MKVVKKDSADALEDIFASSALTANDDIFAPSFSASSTMSQKPSKKKLSKTEEDWLFSSPTDELSPQHSDDVPLKKADSNSETKHVTSSIKSSLFDEEDDAFLFTTTSKPKKSVPKKTLVNSSMQKRLDDLFCDETSHDTVLTQSEPGKPVIIEFEPNPKPEPEPEPEPGFSQYNQIDTVTSQETESAPFQLINDDMFQLFDQAAKSATLSGDAALQGVNTDQIKLEVQDMLNEKPSPVTSPPVSSSTAVLQAQKAMVCINSLSRH